MPEDSSTPVARFKRIGRNILGLSVMVVASATLLAATGAIDGGQYLVVMSGIISVLGVDRAMNGNRN